MKHARDLVLPCALCAATFAIALAMAIAGRVTGTRILIDYVIISLVTSGMAFLIWMLVPWLRGPDLRRAAPFRAASAMLRERWLLLILPLAIFPIFMTGFTVSKISFPAVHRLSLGRLLDRGRRAAVQRRSVAGHSPADRGQGHPGDRRLLHADLGPDAGLGASALRIFGQPPRRHPRLHRADGLLVPDRGGRRRRFLLGRPDLRRPGRPGAGGAVRAAPSVAGRDPAARRHRSSSPRPISAAPCSCAEAVRAGGVSAMPSMHLALCTILILLAWRSMWRIPAFILWTVIWVGSVHLGYHYALDGIVSSAMAGVDLEADRTDGGCGAGSVPTEAGGCLKRVAPNGIGISCRRRAWHIPPEAGLSWGDDWTTSRPSAPWLVPQSCCWSCWQLPLQSAFERELAAGACLRPM